MKRDAILLACLGGLLEISILAVYFFTGINRTSTLLEPFFAIPFLLYLGIVVWITRAKSTDFQTSTIIVILVSIVLYLTFLFQTPTLSGDIYRYIWDGKLLSNGISPYEYAPFASQLCIPERRELVARGEQEHHLSVSATA